MEPTDYAHLSWDAFQQARGLALRRMRPDGGPCDPGELPAGPPAVARVVIATARDAREDRDGDPRND